MNKILTIIFILLTMSYLSNAQQGVTWGPSGDIAMNSLDNNHPRVVYDRSGNPMVIWGKISDQSVYFSRWNGTAFIAPVKLNPMGMTIANQSWMGPDIAAHGDTVYVVAKRTPESVDTNRIFIFTSFNGGVSFNPPVELAFIADSLSRFPTVTTDASGNPIVGFMKFDPISMMNARWVVTRSNDYGATFSTDVKASGWGASQSVCDCCPGSIISNGDTSVMLYRNNYMNTRDSWAGISSDNAQTFTSGMDVDNNNWVIVSCPSSGPDGIIYGDTLYSVFMNGASGITRVYLSKTDLASGTLSSVNTLTGNIPNLTTQNFPRIASYGNAAGIVWYQSSNGVDQVSIHFTADITSGFAAVYDTVDLNSIVNTDIAIGNGSIIVVWQDDNSGTVKFRKGTFTPVNTSLIEHHETEIEIFPNPSGDYLNISSLVKSQSIDFQIFNSIGEVVYQEDKFNGLAIDISGLIDGIYFLQVITTEHAFTAKFIKD